ncbi:MAG: signal peptide peptidase SppA [Deltaproteobacteria bacterium]|nr:signal peptide peptidase SppA [Deltaproteobacteria bacterium]
MAEKKKRGSFSMAVLVVLLLMGGSCTGGLIWLASSGGVSKGTVLEIRLDGPLTEGPTKDIFAELSGQKPLSLYSLRQGLRAAAEDDDIAAVLVEVSTPAMGMASLEEVASELDRFREKSGKPLHVLLQTDMVYEPHVYLAGAATKSWATPTAFWMLNGLQVDVPFWKGTLEKLHIEPDFIMFKEYKSAGEPYSRSEMSEYFREAITDVAGDLQDLWYERVAARTGVDREKLKALVDQGMQTGEEARALGLFDAYGYLDEVEEELRTVAGTDEYESISIGRYLMKVKDKVRGEHIAVIFGEGQIVASRQSGGLFGGGMLHGPVVAAHIREAADEEDVKAIVFRVNSPGGSAVGSDLVWREIERAQKLGKPVVVSMSDVAGSGGYWVSMGADAIVAQPATITGSIGVVFGKFNLRGFYEWIGANVETIKFAENSDIMSEFASLSDEQRARTVSVLDSLYTDFKRKVGEGRSIELPKVEELAKGRIWSGRDAVGKGLVDETGGLETAVQLAAKKAGLGEDVKLKAYPEPKDLWQMIQDGELGASVQAAQPLPDAAAIEAWLRDLEQPRTLALMPDVQVR